MVEQRLPHAAVADSGDRREDAAVQNDTDDTRDSKAIRRARAREVLLFTTQRHLEQKTVWQAIAC